MNHTIYSMIDIDLLLAWGATYKKIRTGEIIFQEGQSCFFYYQLVSGKVKWVNVDDSGRECIHSIVEPGESFGELPLFDGNPFEASGIAGENSLIIRLHKSSFLQLLNENNRIHFAFTKLLSNRIRFSYSIIDAYGSHRPGNRIAALINNLKRTNRNFLGKEYQLSLTRQEIADMTGLRVETVIRTMRIMHEKGEILISRGKVYCPNMIELQ